MDFIQKTGEKIISKKDAMEIFPPKFKLHDQKNGSNKKDRINSLI